MPEPLWKQAKPVDEKQPLWMQATPLDAPQLEGEYKSDPLSEQDWKDYFAGNANPKVTQAFTKKKINLRSLPESLEIQPLSDWRELALKYGIDPEKLGPGEGAAQLEKYNRLANRGKSKGVLDTFMRTIERGVPTFRGAMQGVEQKFADVIPDSLALTSGAAANDLSAAYNQDIAKVQNRDNPGTLTFSTLAADLPAIAALPGGPIVRAGGKAAVNTGKAMLGGFGAGLAQEQVGPERNRLGNAFMGMIAAPVAQVGAEGALSGLTKLYAGVGKRQLPAQFQELQQKIRAAGAEPNAADLIDDPTSWITWLRDRVSNAPVFNFSAQNQSNSVGLRNTLNNMVTGTRANMLAQPVSELPLIQELSVPAITRKQNPEALRAVANLNEFTVPGSPSKAMSGSVGQADIIGNKFRFQQNTPGIYAKADAMRPVTELDLGSLLDEAKRLRGGLATAGETANNPTLASDLERAIADLTPQRPPDHLGIMPAQGRGPVVGGGVAEAPKPFDHLGLTPPSPGRGPVVGGGEVMPEARDIYGTVIDPAVPPRPMSNAPSGPSQLTTAPQGFSEGPIAPPSESSGMPHDIGSLDRFLRVLRDKKDAAFAAGDRERGNAINSLIQKAEETKNTNTDLEAYIKEKASADAEYANTFGRFVDGSPNKNLSGAQLNALLKLPPDRFAAALKNLSPSQTRELLAVYGPAGRSAHFHTLVEDIVTNSMNTAETSANQLQSGEFLKRLSAQMERIGEVATPLELSQVNAIQEVMQHMKQVGNTGGNNPNWTRWIWAQPFTVLKPLLTTDTGKRMMLTLSASRTGSAARQKVLQGIEQFLGQNMALGFTSGGSNPVNQIPPTPEDLETE